MALNRVTVIVIVVVIIVAVVLSAFAYLYSPKPYLGKIESVTVGAFNNELNSLIFIAEDRQYFSTYGLNVMVKEYNSGLAALNGMLNGESNISTAAEFVLASKALENQSIYTFASDCKANSISLIAQTNKGISNFSDLVGKKVGVALGTNVQFFLGRFLELNGVNESQLTIVNVPFDQSVTALSNDTVDAIATTEPYVNQIQNLLGSNAVSWSAQANQPFYFDLICSNTWGNTHHEVIQRFLKALVQAENFAIDHQDEAQAIVMQRLDYTQMYLANVWSNYQFAVSLDQAQLLAMQDQAQWILTNNLTNATTIPNFLNYVHTEDLTAVKPDAVTIIQ